MRVVIVRLSALGDVVQTLPLVHALQAAIPGLELAWAIQPPFAELVAPFARTFLFERRGGFRAWPALARELRAFRPDLALDAQGNLKSAVATRASGAPRRVGFAPEDWREPFSRLALTEAAPPAPGPHLVERVWNLAQHVVEGLSPTPRLDPLLTTHERVRGRALLGERAPTGGGRLWILHPGRAGDPRSWPLDAFKLLAQRLLEAQQRVLFLTGPAEADLGARLQRELRPAPGLAHWVGQRGLRDLVAVFDAARAQGARIVVGDSGPAHLAASVGLPVRLLAGPTSPHKTGPWPCDAAAALTHAVHRTLLRPYGAWQPRAIDEVDPDAAANELLREDGAG
ncbi:MAG: glycosyltransferase family 9 protein [Planctomycetota bacterium]